MDFIDDAVTKAKEAFDVACKKTSEVVTTQKQKFDIASLEAKRTKDFEALGRFYYSELKDNEIENEEAARLVAAIDEKNAKIEELRREINNIKNKRLCPKCGASIDKCSVYCNFCGEKLVFESAAEPETEEKSEKE